MKTVHHFKLFLSYVVKLILSIKHISRHTVPIFGCAQFIPPTCVVLHLHVGYTSPYTIVLAVTGCTLTPSLHWLPVGGGFLWPSRCSAAVEEFFDMAGNCWRFNIGITTEVAVTMPPVTASLRTSVRRRHRVVAGTCASFNAKFYRNCRL